MIAHLRGVVIELGPSYVVVECAGVGYRVNVSVASLAAVGAVGSKTALRIHTQFSAQDGSMSLYGFSSLEEKQDFDLLLGVKGVSAAKALPILSGASPEKVAQLIAEGRVSELRSFKGVGKKTAETLVFELQEKCETLIMTWGASGTPVRALGSRKVRVPALEEVSSALLALGWRPAEVDSAVDQLDVVESSTLESLLRQALQTMPR